MANGLPKYFVCRWIVGIQPTIKFLPRSFFGHFYCQSRCFSRLGILVLQIRWWPVLQQGLKSIFIHSDSFFNILVPSKCFFSLPAVILSCFRSQLSTADGIIAVWNNDYSILMSSEISGSCWNFVSMLDANCFFTSLSAKASHLIL